MKSLNGYFPFLNRRRRYDAGIIGAGVQGLTLAYRLARAGYRVAVFERSQKIAERVPSTMNEGWAHCGGYHAQSILDFSEGVTVAKRCRRGAATIRELFPEAMELTDMSSYSCSFREDRIEEIEGRWECAGVRFQPVSNSVLRSCFSGISTDRIVRAWKMDDFAVNTRALYGRLLSAARATGRCDIFTGVEAHFEDTTAGAAKLHATGSQRKVLCLQAPVWLYAAGYGNADVYGRVHGIRPQLRFFKSHLGAVNWDFRDGIYCLDAHEVGGMPHVSHCNGRVRMVFGQNEDAVQVDSPDGSPIPERHRLFVEGVRRLFPDFGEEDLAKFYACTKVDVPDRPGAARSLNVKTLEPVPNHILVWPGKMTEAFATMDSLAEMVGDRLRSESGPQVAMRPLDAEVAGV
ncbi:MAG: FAD-binding oxidoreductase [Opitutales bacterium]|nr:FAD-binding oxidoreductase [Opitutales bacterium]